MAHNPVVQPLSSQLMVTGCSQTKAIFSFTGQSTDSLLNCQSTISDEVIDSLFQRPVLEELSMNLSLEEFTKAIKQLYMGMSSG